MKKINFLGDSITQGACATKRENTYCALVAEHFKAQERNFGIGGTNDYGHGDAKMGTFGDTGDTLTADGLHPNDYGHKLLA